MLFIQDSYLSGNDVIGVDVNGVVAITTASGTTKFTNFETIEFGSNRTASTIIQLGTAGNDAVNIITGGMRRDVVTGGLGRDIFDFNAVNETTKDKATSDYITGFAHKQDRIDLSTIDANMKMKGNQAFKFMAVKGAA